MVYSKTDKKLPSISINFFRLNFTQPSEANHGD